MNRNIARLMAALAAVMLWTTALSAQPSPPEPLVYEGIDFPQLPYPSRYLEVNGALMHYQEAGAPGGQPILLLHGNPTWSYLWRSVMPHLEAQGRVIAPDLIGMGKSDKPDIAYTIAEQRDYLWQFYRAVGLREHRVGRA